jgi:hypothetical protein
LILVILVFRLLSSFFVLYALIIKNKNPKAIISVGIKVRYFNFFIIVDDLMENLFQDKLFYNNTQDKVTEVLNCLFVTKFRYNLEC